MVETLESDLKTLKKERGLHYTTRQWNVRQFCVTDVITNGLQILSTVRFAIFLPINEAARTMKKKPFLVVYDYGQGGVWAVINARSKSEIKKKYPGLKIYRRKPLFMKKAMYDSIAADMTVNIDDEPSGWLAELKKQETP